MTSGKWMTIKEFLTTVDASDWKTEAGYTLQDFKNIYGEENIIYNWPFFVEQPQEKTIILSRLPHFGTVYQITLTHRTATQDYYQFYSDNPLSIMAHAHRLGELSEAFFMCEQSSQDLKNYCREYILPVDLHNHPNCTYKCDDIKMYCKLFVASWTRGYQLASARREEAREHYLETVKIK